MTKYCKNCGSELEDAAVFCDECGTKFGETRHSYMSDNPFNSYKIDVMDGERIIKHSLIHKGCLYAPIAVIFIGFLWWILEMTAIANFSYYYSPDPIVYLWAFFNPFIIIGVIWFVIRYIGYIGC